MSSTDKTKLDGIDTGAQVNVLESVTASGTAPLTLTAGSISNKSIAISGSIADASTSAKGVVKIGDGISVSNGVISVTAANIGLGDVENTKLSTWSGSSNITTIGTLSSGTVPWARLSNVPTTISGYGITDAVTDVSWDSTNQKIQKTINGNTTDVITIPFTNGAGTWSAKMKGCTADGNFSFAAGQNSQATGIGSVALISGVATQLSAVAIGAAVSNTKTTASGIGSIAIGGAATASGLYAIALGYKPNSTGTCSIAIGAESIAGANYSLAFGGRGTKASSQYQTTMGKWNIEDNQDTYAFILGNGTADSARSNALTVDWNGNLIIAGSLDWSSISNTPTTVAGYGITDVPTISIVRW